MADVKISALPASTTPLAGTEVLPIVQGTTTKQVSIANVTAGRAVAALSITTATVQATNSGGLALKNSGGTTQISVGSGGGDNLTISVATNITPANAAVAISPTGTGTVAISPVGALTINPTAASTINNTSIGITTAAAGGFTTVKAATTIGVGAATPAASGAGITFPASQSASSDVNTLDDYEEGTWTPLITTDDTPPTTVTYGIQTGTYTKVGNIVTCNCILQTSSVSGVGFNGSVIITGIPFAAANNTAVKVSNASAWTAITPLSGYVWSIVARIFLMYRSTTTGADTLVPYTALGTGASSNNITISFTYQAS